MEKARRRRDSNTACACGGGDLAVFCAACRAAQGAAAGGADPRQGRATAGAGAATAYALLSVGVDHLVVTDRDLDRAQAVAAKYASWFPDQVISVRVRTNYGQVASRWIGW